MDPKITIVLAVGSLLTLVTLFWPKIVAAVKPSEQPQTGTVPAPKKPLTDTRRENFDRLCKLHDAMPDQQEHIKALALKLLEQPSD